MHDPQHHHPALNWQRHSVNTALATTNAHVLVGPVLRLRPLSVLRVEDAPAPRIPTAVNIRRFLSPWFGRQVEHHVAVDGPALHHVAPDSATQLVAHRRLFAHESEDTPAACKITIGDRMPWLPTTHRGRRRSGRVPGLECVNDSWLQQRPWPPTSPLRSQPARRAPPPAGLVLVRPPRQPAVHPLGRRHRVDVGQLPTPRRNRSQLCSSEHPLHGFERCTASEVCPGPSNRRPAGCRGSPVAPRRVAHRSPELFLRGERGGQRAHRHGHTNSISGGLQGDGNPGGLCDGAAPTDPTPPKEPSVRAVPESGAWAHAAVRGIEAHLQHAAPPTGRLASVRDAAEQRIAGDS